MVTLYMTKKRIKGVDGLKYYYVEKKGDIKKLGGSASLSTSFPPSRATRVYESLTGKKHKIVLV